MALTETEQTVVLTDAELAGLAFQRLVGLAQVDADGALDPAQLTRALALLADTVLAMFVATATPPQVEPTPTPTADDAAHFGQYL